MTPVDAAAAAKLVGTAGAGAAATVLMQATDQAMKAPHDTSLWELSVMGVSLAILGACLFASFIRTFRDPPQPQEKLPLRAFGAFVDAMVGGWITVFLIHLPYTAGFLGSAIPPPAIGAVFTLAFQFLRTRAPKWIDAVMGESVKEVAKALGDILKSWLARRPGGGTGGGGA